jgi:hypothetical protein
MVGISVAARVRLPLRGAWARLDSDLFGTRTSSGLGLVWDSD